jgi:hypothetical protein
VSLRHRSRLPFLLAALAAGLAGAVVWQARLAPDIRAAAALPAAAPPAVPAGAVRIFSPPPLDHYAGLLARPPFAPDRRAPAVEAAAAPPPAASTLPALRCAAIVQAPGGAFALVEVAGRERLVRARPGDVVAGWSILAVGPRSIRMEGPDGEVTLALVSTGGSAGEDFDDDFDDGGVDDEGFDVEDLGDEDLDDEDLDEEGWGDVFEDEDLEEESAGIR